VRAVSALLGVGRASAYRPLVARGRYYRRREDAQVAAQIRAVIGTRASYGHRRVRAMVNRQFGTRYNKKRIRRVMALWGWTLPRRGSRPSRPHTGLIRRPRPNERWCSDALEIACWNREVAVVAFALDCHDRECLAACGAAGALLAADIQALMRDAVASRFGDQRPEQPIQWLSDNGSIYTALDTVVVAEQLGLEPITTPAASPESNGMAEAFVWTLRRDYLDGADLSSAAVVLAQLPAWIADYNTHAPHSALNHRSPRQYRDELALRVVPGVSHESGD